MPRILHVRLGEYLYESGRDDAALAALERAVELAPPEPPSAERAYALAGRSAGGLMLRLAHAESLRSAEEALALARGVGAARGRGRALTVLGGDLAYVGRGDEGLVHLQQAIAARRGDRRSPGGYGRAYVNLTDGADDAGTAS